MLSLRQVGHSSGNAAPHCGQNRFVLEFSVSQLTHFMKKRYESHEGTTDRLPQAVIAHPKVLWN
jgi:hypothetical protein